MTFQNSHVDISLVAYFSEQFKPLTFCCDILSDISSDIVSGISSPDNLSGISPDIISDISSDILPDIISDNLSGISPDSILIYILTFFLTLFLI